MSNASECKTCLACGGKLRKFTKTEDWDERQFHLNCWDSLISAHVDTSLYFKKLNEKYEKLEVKVARRKNRYLKRKGVKLEFKEFDKPITLDFS